MRIVFWNIRAGGGTRVAVIARQLESWAPDVVGLCEFRATPPSLALASRLAALGLVHQSTTLRCRPPSVNCLLIASRWPVSRIRLRTEPAEPGRWLLGLVDAPRPLTVGAMHVPNRVSGRKDAFYAGVLAMLGRWRRGPAVVVGDTNSGHPEIDEETRVFGPREASWLDALDRLGWVDAFRRVHGPARTYTWYSPNGRNGFRLDQAFVNRDLASRVRDVRYDWCCDGEPRHARSLPSDHAALLLDMDC